MSNISFGADYYPEQWDSAMWESDFARMQKMGLSVVRLMEFAWAMLEPNEGVYDFSFFDNILNMMSKYNLKAVLGTPTATVPIWLFEKDNSIMQTNFQGMYRGFGARRQPCFNSKTYLDAAYRITEKIAEHYGNHPAIIGWQVDNEIGHEGSDRCICNNCRNAWHTWLENKYNNIAELNSVWGTVFWSTTYSRFDQIPVPQTTIGTIQNPTLIVDYYRFLSDSASGFADNQTRILRGKVSASHWITTNLYSPTMSTVIDMVDVFKNMDFPGYNNYPVWGDMDEPIPYFMNGYMLDYIRGLKDNKNYTVFEQICGFQGHQCLGYLPPDDQIVSWTNQAIAHGGNRIIYFRWRTAAFAQEQLCHGLINTDNYEGSLYKSIEKNIKDNSPKFEEFASTPYSASACVIYTKDNSRLIRDQYQTKALCSSPTPFLQIGYDIALATAYAPFSIFNINTDVKSTKNVDLSKYKIITLPQYIITEDSFVDKLDAWVRAGGTLILGWRSGLRDEKNHTVMMDLPGKFTEMAGVVVHKFESLNNTKIKMKIGFLPAKATAWADIVEPVTAKVIARYSDSNKHYKGSAAITKNSHGKGTVYYLGTTPNEIGVYFLYKKIFKEAGVPFKFFGVGVEVITRETVNGGQAKVYINHTNKCKKADGVKLKPHESKILIKGK